MSQTSKESVDELVIQATNNFTKILSTNEIKENYKGLYWGGNGVGDSAGDASGGGANGGGAHPEPFLQPGGHHTRVRQWQRQGLATTGGDEMARGVHQEVDQQEPVQRAKREVGQRRDKGDCLQGGRRLSAGWE